MKEVIKFLAFICYATAIFFIPDNYIILLAIAINIVMLLITKVNLKSAVKNITAFLPFILFTVIINCLLDYYKNAIYIGVKLMLVCNITFIYSKTTSIRRICKNYCQNMYAS